MSDSRRFSVRFCCILALTLAVVQGAIAQPSDASALRRKALSERLGKGIAVVAAPAPGARGSQENKDFLYLMGGVEPDAVLVTEAGNHVLTVRAPKEIADIEKTMKMPATHGLLK